MSDTSPEFEAMVNERYRRMTPDERVRIAASMYDTARAIVSIVPTGRIESAGQASRIREAILRR
jgi:hypothetical protein